MKKRKIVLISSLVIISLLITLLVRYNDWAAEHVFARGTYKILSQLISNITGIISFSIMELSLYVFVVLIIILGIYVVRTFFIKKDNKKEKLINLALNIGCMFSILLFLFVNFAGVNYYRYSFSYINGLEVEDSNVEELYQLNMYLAKQAYDLREELELHKDYINQDGVFEFNKTNWRQLTDKVELAYINVSEDYPVLKGNYGRIKPVLSSKIMSSMKITGIFWPFTLEANVNIDAPDYTIPATMVHEMAHLRGFMREDEANFIAYLVCNYSDSLAFQYSGTMLALTYAGNALYRENPILYAETRELFNEGMVADLRHKSVYWNKYSDTVISTASNKINDTYLKINNQKDGVKSYGRMVDLLLADFKAKNSN